MLSSTVALAAAANYPSPFVKSGVADVAVVYGSNAAQTDLVAATDITTNLNSKLTVVTTEPTEVTGGDFVKLEKANNKFNLGESMSSFYGGSLDNEQLSTVLADGVYTNDANDDFDFEQEIVLGTNLPLSYFQDSDLNDEAPTIGFNLVNNNHILNYTLDFTPDAADCGDFGLSTSVDDDCETTDLTMLGRSYYIVKTEFTANGVKLTLLDSANSATVTEGEASTVSVAGNSYDVSIVFVDSSKVILDVNGVQTNKLAEGDVFKVGTDMYVGVKNILYNEKESGISKVEISLGSGKIVMENGQEVEINNEDVSENSPSVVTATITNSSDTEIDKIILDWTLDDDAFVAPGTDLVLPGFETLKFSMGGFVEPSKEVTNVENNGDESLVLKTEVKDGSVTLGLLHQNSSNTGFDAVGKDTDEKLVTSNGNELTINLTNDDTYFVASWTDGAEDSESYVFEVTGIGGSKTENTTTIKNVATSATAAELDVGDDKDVGEINLKVYYADQDLDVVKINVTASAGGTTGISTDKLYTKEGMKIQLPVNSVVAGDGNLNFTAGNPTSFKMNFTEEDEDDKIDQGVSFDFTITPTTDGPSVGSPSLSELDDAADDDIKLAYVSSALATKTVRDTGSDPTTLDVEYHGSESYAEVYISETDTAVVPAGEAANKVLAVKDSESVSAKNLIVVGGSCINSVAADLLGGSLCGADFEAKTGVGAGSFLIETFARDGGNVATLVAGYNAEDTTNAAKYLTTQTVDTTVGQKYKGTTATSAELVVA
jgi:hypothetical protein